MFTAIAIEVGDSGIQAHFIDELGNFFEMIVLAQLLVALAGLPSYQLASVKSVAPISFELVMYDVWF